MTLLTEHSLFLSEVSEGGFKSDCVLDKLVNNYSKSATLLTLDYWSSLVCREYLILKCGALASVHCTFLTAQLSLALTSTLSVSVTRTTVKDQSQKDQSLDSVTIPYGLCY